MRKEMVTDPMVFVVVTIEQQINLALGDLAVEIDDHKRRIDHCGHVVIDHNRVAVWILAILFADNDFNPTKVPHLCHASSMFLAARAQLYAGSAPAAREEGDGEGSAASAGI
jgi:hypothetical protein